MSTITEFIASQALTLEVTRMTGYDNAKMAELWGKGASHWVVTVYNGSGYSFDSEYHQGSLIRTPPKLEDVLECLAGDAASGMLTFEEFCENFGYNSDSIRDHKTWEKCRETNRQLQNLFGLETFAKFMMAIDWN